MLKFVMDAVAGNLQAHARRRAQIYGLAGVAALAALVACGYGVSALHIWVAARYDPLLAALVFGGVFLLLALAFAVAALILARRPPPPDPTAALTGALMPVALAMVAQFLQPGAARAHPRPAAAPEPEPPPEPAPGTDEPQTNASAAHGGASGALLVLVPALLVGLLVGRKLRS